MEKRFDAYLGSEGHDTVEDLGHVASFVQINRLERAGFWYTICLAGDHEVLDVLHLWRREILRLERK
jgi:hypothetical protein